jgi:hypothetical protein
MDCPECKQEFDESSHIPRILTSCGHTICETCMKLRFKKKSILCPQCAVTTNTSSLSSLPTNLALIQLKQKKRAIEVCEKHKKPIEAFCCNDKLLVCVLCLVEDGHKSHELSTIQKAARKFRDNLTNYLVLAQNHQESIQKEIKELSENQSNIMTTYAKTVKNFSVVFEILKKIVIEKEILIKERLKKTLQDEVQTIKSKTQTCSNLLQNIENFKAEVSNSGLENDTEFILKYPKREDLGKIVTNRALNPMKLDPFQQFSPENEVATVIKLIQEKFYIRAETKQTPPTQKKKMPINVKEAPKAKISSRPSNKTIPKPLPSLDWDNISAISRAHSDEDTLSTRSFDFNLLNRASNAKIFTISGFSEKAISSVEAYDTSNDLWGFLPECLSARTQFAGILHSGNLLLLGGKQGGKRVSSCEELCLASMTWKESALAIPSGRSGFAAISLSSNL